VELRLLGRSGVRVSRYCLGAMAFGALGNRDHADCVRIIHAALDAGINTVDTADVYSRGESEEIVGEALRGRRDAVVLATKCFWPMGDGPNQRGLSRRWITTAVQASLRRLGTDWIDILYLHKPDPDTNLAESLGALDDLVRQGTVRMIGTSTLPAEQIVEAHWTAASRRLEAPVVEQPAYSLFARGAERDVLPTCVRYGMGAMVFSPLNGGWLTGKYRAGVPAEPGSRATRWTTDHSVQPDSPVAPTKAALVDALSAVAVDAGCGLAELAMAFVLEHPAVSSAIIGPRTMGQLEQLLAGEALRLDDEVLDRVDGIVAPGSDVDPADRWYRPTALVASARRRPR